MKQHKEVTSDRRKCRKAHLSAPSHIRRKLMSAGLSKELRRKHGVRALPLRKDDEVSIVQGHSKGMKGKIVQVYRRRWYVHIEKFTKNKANGAPYHVAVRPSNCVIVKLKLGKDRQDLITRKTSAASTKGKGEKYTSGDVMKNVD